METTVDKMVDDILEREGGFVDHPLDRGGATNYGITQETYSRWLHRPATVEEVRALSPETAREIYKRNYFYEPRIDALVREVQPFTFDAAVNHGSRRAVKFLQVVVNKSGFGPVEEDGVVGPQTRDAVKKACEEMQEHFINAAVEERVNFYHRIVAAKPEQSVFLKGWINRAREFEV